MINRAKLLVFFLAFAPVALAEDGSLVAPAVESSSKSLSMERLAEASSKSRIVLSFGNDGTLCMLLAGGPGEVPIIEIVLGGTRVDFLVDKEHYLSIALKENVYENVVGPLRWDTLVDALSRAKVVAIYRKGWPSWDTDLDAANFNQNSYRRVMKRLAQRLHAARR